MAEAFTTETDDYGLTYNVNHIQNRTNTQNPDNYNYAYGSDLDINQIFNNILLHLTNLNNIIKKKIIYIYNKISNKILYIYNVSKNFLIYIIIILIIFLIILYY